MPLSGVSNRSGPCPMGLDGTMTDLFIHLVAYQLVTLSGTGVSVLDQGPVSLFIIFDES